jgi:hypothetical protein
MLAKFKDRWLRPRVLGVIAAKIILSGTTGLAALTVHLPSVPSAGHAVTVIHLPVQSNQ